MADPVEIFRQSVREYLQIDEQLKKASKDLSAVKKQKNELGELIREFMTKNNYDAVSSENATITRKETSRKSSIKENDILEIAKKFLGESETEKFMEQLNSTRDVIIKDKINVKQKK